MQRLKQLVKRLFPRIIYGAKTGAAAKARLLQWSEQWKERKPGNLPEAGYDLFTYHGEDGIIRYLLQQMQEVPPSFVDIGSGDCVKSNCAALATHFGWKGIFIDNDPQQLAVGRSFYKHIPGNSVNLSMICQEITPGNVNEVLNTAGMNGEIGLLSIDVDGNDYWIWKAIETVRPRLVVIEAKVEFGDRELVVPYGRNNHRSIDPQYNGASVRALRKLGEAKGYTLAGSNQQGYNLFFVRKEERIPAAATADILRHAQHELYPETFFQSHEFAAV